MCVCDSAEKDFVWERGIDGMWIRAVRKFRQVPKYTSSVDDALAFAEKVLPGWGACILTFGLGGKYPTMQVERSYPTNLEVAVQHHTLPLAIVLATLKAKAAEQDKPE